MKHSFQSLRTKLFLWYIGSLLLLTVFFYIFVHILALPYGTDIFYVIFFILAVIGFIVIYRITSSLTYLTSRMKLISRKNLAERITDIKRTDEIGELARTFNNLLDGLNKAFKREQQFIADVAHELKTPLATLHSTLEVARSKKRSSEEYEKVIDEAILETTHISSTLKNVLDLAWSETPSEQKNAKRFNLSELMEEIGEITQKMVIKKGLKVQTFIAKEIYIMGFRDKLARALLNIIDNAINYTQKGEIEITLKTVKHTAFIIIKDTGPGIEESELPYVFDRFYRGSKTEKVFGSGLGLAIAKSVITLHNGTIEAESKPGKGSSFIIALPLAQSS